LLPVRRILFLVVRATFLEDPTLAESASVISSSLDADDFRRCVDAISGAPPDITDANIANLSSLVAEFGFV
jgi:hypothetical protein